MAITAEFTADFSDFVRGSKQATDALKDVERSTKGVADSSAQALGSMKGLALDLAGAFGIAFSVGAVVGFTKELIASASALEKMHATTGITVEELQRMAIVGDGVGVSITTMTSAATRLQAALGKGDKGVASALADLGINLETFKNLGAAEQMAAVADAVRGIEDPLRLAADLQEIYGKGWADLFPALKAGFEAAGDDVTVMSSRTVTALDAAGNKVAEFYRATKANLGEALADVLTLSTSEWRRLKSEVDQATAAAAKMHPEGLLPASKGLVDTSNAAALLNAGLKEQQASIEASIATNKKYAETLKAVQKIEEDRYEVGSGLLGLSLEQQKNTQARFEGELKALTGIEAAEAKLRDVQMRASLDTSTYQIMKIWERADAEIAAFKGTEAQAKTHADLVYSIASVEAQGITDVMAGAIDQMVGMASSALDETKANADAAVAEAKSYQMAGSGYKPTAAQLDEYYKTSQGIQDIIRNQGKRYYAGEVAPRAGGGPVSAGSPYLVGERGPGLFVPHTGGSIVPGGHSIVIHVEGSVLSTKEALARVVGDALISSYRTGGARLPV